MWDLAGMDENRSMRRGTKRIGGGMESVDGHHSWSNIWIIPDMIGYEMENEEVDECRWLRSDRVSVMEGRNQNCNAYPSCQERNGCL